jgi:acyl-CoA hydrolase
VWSRAARRVAHINPRMPRTQGGFRVHISKIDVAVEADAPLLEFTEPPAGDIEQRIGAHAAALVHDGDTLQFGIGSVPLALGRALASHRQLRFHGGLVSSALRTLWEAGALDHKAPVTTGVVLGDAAFHDFATRLPALSVCDVTHTHNLAVLAAIPRFVAINSAIEVDLFGQVNAERRLLIGLAATARKGTVSRIVPVLTDQSLCTLPRHLADAVVTEHGVAELRGLSLDARAEALIAIAAPEHRDTLQAAWSALRRNA